MSWIIQTADNRNSEFVLENYSEAIDKLAELSQKWADERSSYRVTLNDDVRYGLDRILFSGLIGDCKPFTEELIYKYNGWGQPNTVDTTNYTSEPKEPNEFSDFNNGDVVILTNKLDKLEKKLEIMSAKLDLLLNSYISIQE